ncbi:MAG: hypothetical protein P8074_02780 [Anaerolineales bacterium]|jgi:hypothetical protein
MNDIQLKEQVQELFLQAAKAHHQAFLETNGEDPEWPLWYARYMQNRLTAMLGANLTLSELVYLIVWAEKERSLNAPGADWAPYYTRFLLKNFS